MSKLFKDSVQNKVFYVYLIVSSLFFYNLFLSNKSFFLELLPVLSTASFYLMTPLVIFYSVIAFLRKRTVKQLTYLMIMFVPGLIYAVWFISLAASLSSFWSIFDKPSIHGYNVSVFPIYRFCSLDACHELLYLFIGI